ncbi:MAG TPA: putative baseplate assembly protein [Actinoplanes sp.]|jgi:hypothetical protein
MRPLTEYLCDDPDGRRQSVLAGGTLNGIDDVQVEPGHRTLLVRCLRPVPPGLSVSVSPVGASRPVEVAATGPSVVGPAVLEVRLVAPGDPAAYRIMVTDPAAGFDPRLSQAVFDFGVDCDADRDCAAAAACVPPGSPEPVIDYLSRDYAGLRQLLLDRLSVVAPGWADRNPADIGVTLVEIFAYLGDLLAAAQDAVSAEAYLGTARRRVSVGRHARLLDYRMHQGAAARTWLVLTVDEDVSAGFARRNRKVPDPVMIPAGHQVRSGDSAVVFHTLHAVTPVAARNAIDIHTWGQRGCCLPCGATGATLVGTAGGLGLAAGEVLVLEEVRGETAADPPDVTHRWPVRLTSVTDAHDPVTRTDVVEVTWDEEDALPFALWVRRFPRGRCFDDLPGAVARGNVVLAGHGERVADDPLIPDTVPVTGRYRPALGRKGLAFAVPYTDDRTVPARRALRIDPQLAVPDLIRVTDGRDDWTARDDLLGSDRFGADFVAEPDDDGTVRLRFGDDSYGRRPAPGADRRFRADYRIGGGVAGNAGRDVLTVPEPPIAGVWVRNPLPAVGGAEPEPVEQVRQLAPQAFRTQQRAVTDDDYAAVARSDPRVQRAVATRRWTGSWFAESVTVDRIGGTGLDPALRDDLAARLDRSRMAGTDVEVRAPIYVPIDIGLSVCVAPGYFRGTVKRSLVDRFSDRDLGGGDRGFFHPDNFTFAQPVYLSAVVAAAMAVAGVARVDADRFGRLGRPDEDLRGTGLIAMDRVEVARCDSEPEDGTAGRITFEMAGGR